MEPLPQASTAILEVESDNPQWPMPDQDSEEEPRVIDYSHTQVRPYQ